MENQLPENLSLSNAETAELRSLVFDMETPAAEMETLLRAFSAIFWLMPKDSIHDVLFQLLDTAMAENMKALKQHESLFEQIVLKTSAKRHLRAVKAPDLATA